MKGVLTVISGFSGVGKGTVAAHMRSSHDFMLSVSATTRPPRPGEEEGRSYYFLTEEDFLKKAENGYFLEWAHYTSGCYGTPRGPVLKALEEGQDVILEIESNGAMQIRKQYPEALLIFVLPPSWTVLESRLRGRGTESEQDVIRRLDKAVEEFQSIPDYDAVVVNETVEQCADEIFALMQMRRQSPACQKERIDRLYQEACDARACRE